MEYSTAGARSGRVTVAGQWPAPYTTGYVDSSTASELPDNHGTEHVPRQRRALLKQTQRGVYEGFRLQDY